MKILVDTSVIIDFLRRESPQNSCFSRLAKDYNLSISLVTVVELYSGRSVRRKETRERIDKIISAMEIFIPDLGISKEAGLLRSAHDLSLSDAIIASTALSQKIMLATLDHGDFKNIKGIKLVDLNKS